MSSHVPPIAIVGIGCLFPQATDLQAYWRNILAARDCLSDVPKDHSWSPDDYYDPDPTAPDKTWATRGGFLDKIPFDPLQFGIPPAQLESIDTSQLLSLIVARAALADAGIDPDATDWDRDRVACIVGVTGTQEMAITAGARLQGPIWRKAMRRCGIDPELADIVTRDIANHFPTWTEQTFPGLLGNVVAGRIANRLDLGGTNAVVDAACASSLAAIQYAISDLTAGRSDLVLSGGVDTLNDIFMFECFTRTPAFSKAGDARPFDASSDGILIGEGIALLAFKRLEDAERDGNRIYAVLKGLGSSSDGRHKSIYAPNPTGQAKALRRTYAMAGVDPATIELLEAHGTGTKAGDVAEVTALATVYGEANREGRWVATGSVKSQIGHTKSTAGAAGLVKAAMALHQRVLPPTAKVEQVNPKLDLGPLYVNTRARPWIRAADHPRRAAVSAFGFGGSNFHAVLEEHGPSTVAAQCPAETELFLVGADTPEALIAALDALDGPTVTHASRAALQAFEPGRAHVVGFVASSLDELRERVSAAKARIGGAAPRPRDGVHLGGGDSARVAFVFPGQGSQYVEMGRTLAVRHPIVRAAFDDAEEAFRTRGWPSLAERVFPPPAFSDDERDAQADALRATEWAQPAIGALSKGMADLLGAFGANPDVVAGHSYGELVALHVAGALSAEALWAASRVRGELMSASDRDRGTMAAVNAPLADIEAAIAGIEGVVLANRNHPGQGVISGTRAGIAAALQRLEGKELRVAAAFHSDQVADARDPFRAALADVEVSDPALTVISCASAAPYEGDVRDRLADQILEPVDWVGVVEALVRDGVDVIVEVGPRGVLAGLTEACLGDRPVQVVSLDRLADKEDGDTQLKLALARLAAAGVPVNPAPLLAERPPVAPLTARGPATVMLAGANHREPTTLEPPMPKLPPMSDGWGAVPTSGKAMEKPVHLERSEAEPAPVAAQPPSSDLVALLESTRRTLSAFQAAQEKTAEVHGRFLDAFAKANDNFARLFEAQARLVEQVASGRPAPASVPVPVPVPVPAPKPAPPPIADEVFATLGSVSNDLPPIFDAAVAVAEGKAPKPAPTPAPAAPPGALKQAVLAAVAAKTGYPVDALELSMDLEADLGIDSIKRVEILSAVREARPDLPELDNERLGALRTLGDVVRELEPNQTVPVTRGPSAAGLTDALLEAVAAKTGYPREALEPSMDLEADLGIDSIKRVEILSAVRDAVPGLPEVDNEVLSGLRTLADVVGVLCAASSEPLPALLVPSAPPPRESLINALLESVSAKTGYPRDALELSMDLESDLGVDSIKRVEILSAVRDRVPALPELDNEVLASLRTLQDVADHLSGVAAGLGFAMIGASGRAGSPALLVPPEAPAPAAPPVLDLPPLTSGSDLTAEEPPGALQRAEVQVAPAPPGTPIDAAGTWLVVGDDRVAEALRAAGVEVVAEAVEGLAGVVYLGADPREGFLLAKATGPVPRFVTVSARGGRFGRGEATGDPVQGALAGLAKTLTHEWPGTRPLALDVAPDVDPAAIAREVLLDRGVIEVGLPSDDEAVTLVAAPSLGGKPQELPLSAGDLVVVTGGARGVTAACVIELARRVPLSFLLLGRTEVEDADPAWAAGVADAELVGTRIRAGGVKLKVAEADAHTVRAAREVRATLAAIEAAGATARYAAVDARDAAAVKEAIGEGPVRGLIHGAGVLADKALADKTVEQFDRVWSTKVDGLRALLAACDPADLRAVVMFSSIAGRRGNAGQVDYAMANEALVQHALDLQRAGAVCKALDWGPWDGGMVTASLKAHFERLGHTVVPLDAGARAFADELGRPGVVEVVYEGRRPARGSEERHLSGAAPWLQDHTIADRPVLPAAMVLEWMSSVAGKVAPSLRIASVRGFEVLKGVTLDGPERTVSLTWEPAASTAGGWALRFQLTSPPGPLGLPVVHYRAVVELTDTDAAVARHPGSNGLGAEPYPYEVGEAYRRFLFHGPALQGIDEVVGMSDHGAVAMIRTSTPPSLGVAGERWSTDPLAVDSALQLMLLWVREKRGSCALPSVLGEYRQFGPLIGRLQCHLELEEGADARRGRFAATLVDEGGNVVATLSRSEYTAEPSLAFGKV